MGKPRKRPLADTVIVSGFARTGTTTMIRMLVAGGIEALADKESLGDHGPHHPTGTYELWDVGKHLMEEPPEWTAGCAVKLVAQYMDWLPLNRPLKVIFMLRDPSEIVASLLAQRVIWEDDPVSAVRRARHILEINSVPTLDIHYKEMIKYPRATAVQVADFLERDLDVSAMAAVVDPEARKKSHKAHKYEEGLLLFKADRIKSLDEAPTHVQMRAKEARKK